VARPTMLTRVRHERIVELLRGGVPFATACRTVGVSPSAEYDWLYRGWGTHPDRPSAARYVVFARAVDAVWPGGFVARHEDEDEFPQFPQPNVGFVDAQSTEGTESGRDRENGGETVERPFAEGFCEFRESVTRASAAEFAEVTEPTKSDTQRDRVRAREEDGATEPRRAPMPWLSQRSRRTSILDIEF
jgi:hypothetical protein